jgi:hypothetical protein
MAFAIRIRLRCFQKEGALQYTEAYPHLSLAIIIIERGSHNKSALIGPFFCLVVETFHRNVSTLVVRVTEKGGTKPGFGIKKFILNKSVNKPTSFCPSSGGKAFS